MENSVQQEKDQSSPQKTAKISFKWVILGIGAVLLMWILSSWFFKG